MLNSRSVLKLELAERVNVEEGEGGNVGNCLWPRRFGARWFLFLRWEAVDLGEETLLFGHDKPEMLGTPASRDQGRGSGCGYKFGNHQLIVRTQY